MREDDVEDEEEIPPLGVIGSIFVLECRSLNTSMLAKAPPGGGCSFR